MSQHDLHQQSPGALNAVAAKGDRSWPDAVALLRMGQAVRNGKFTLLISRKLPLKEAAAAHAAIESGLGGKVLLIA
jgi:NADPH:quinone reductase-like Zn-dependent oxidoreductase